MYVEYDGFKLSVIHFTAFEQHPVYSEEGGDYLYTRVFVSVIATCSLAATATKKGVTPPVNATAVNPAFPSFDGDYGPTTVAVVRHKLSQPQKKLRVYIGDQLILEAPQKQTGGTEVGTDCALGPKPKEFSVLEFHGERTAVVKYAVECYINDCLDQGSARLSNRWEASEMIDEHYMSTYHVQGVMVFRRDRLFAGNWEPDFYRTVAMHAVPRGFQREHVRCAVSPDGCKLMYEFQDRQVVWALKPDKGITKVEGRTFVNNDWAPDGVFGVGFVPSLVLGCQARVWGRAGTTRQAIADAVAHILAVGVFGDSGNPFAKAAALSGYSQRQRISVDFPRRYGEGDLQFIGNGIVGGVAAIGAKVLKWGGIEFAVWKDFGTDYWVTNPLSIDGPAPAGKGTRGDSLVGLLTQQLKNPCAIPPMRGRPAAVAKEIQPPQNA